MRDGPASQWLKDDAHRYGLIVRYQLSRKVIDRLYGRAMSICYIGQEAKEVYNSGLSLARIIWNRATPIVEPLVSSCRLV
ncbi:hypothetical protein ACVR1G_10020 [Streptococcus dentasini]